MPIWTEGFDATLPDDFDTSYFEDAAIMSDAVLWLLKQPIDYTGHILTLGELRVYTSAFRPMKYTLSGRHQRTFMKLIVEAATDKVVGVHMVGDDAAELIQGLAVAVKAGATKAQFDATVGIHPTAGEEFVTMRTARVEPAPSRKAAE
jgi:hypothetical protein